MLGVKCLDTDSQHAACRTTVEDLLTALLLLRLEVLFKRLSDSARSLCSELVSTLNQFQPVPEGNY